MPTDHDPALMVPLSELSHETDDRCDGRPVIGVVVSLWFPGMDADSRDLMTSLTAGALQAVRDAGGRPVLHDSSRPDLLDPDAVIDGSDALLFLGGADIDPSLYGGPDEHDAVYGVDRAADEACLDLLRRALSADRRILGICRGSQLLNVACGGTLHPDIDTTSAHRGDPEGELFLTEEVALTPGTRVRRLLGRPRVAVRSGHHQAVAELGIGLIASARADDGIVEGTEHASRTWVLGLQWHPEDPEADPADRERIFGELVRRAAASRETDLRGGLTRKNTELTA